MPLFSPRSRALLAVVPVLAGAAVGASTLGASAQAGPSATPKTTVTLDVTGCEGCTFRLWQAIDGRAHVWHTKAKKVHAGEVVWTVPTGRTSSMSITVQAPWDGGIGAVPNVVFRYAGKQPGDTVTRAEAAKAKRAAGCWVGTEDAAITIPITVAHARTKAVDGSPTHTPRAYTPTTLEWYAPNMRTYRGIIANQDAFYCHT